jgi:S-phase kinase-associated protein 1
MIDDAADPDATIDDEIPLPNVKGPVLTKVLEFCKHLVEEPMQEIASPLKSNKIADCVQQRYADFIMGVDQVMLFELLLASNYLDIKPLLLLSCATVASFIKDRSHEEIRATFNITAEFNPEAGSVFTDVCKLIFDLLDSRSITCRSIIKVRFFSIFSPCFAPPPLSLSCSSLIM